MMPMLCLNETTDQLDMASSMHYYGMCQRSIEEQYFTSIKNNTMSMYIAILCYNWLLKEISEKQVTVNNITLYNKQ